MSSKSSRKRALSRRQFKNIRIPKINGPGDQTRRVNELLVDLSKKTEQQLEYWRVFQEYLVSQRELRKDKILDALKSSSASGYENNGLVRIVDSRYQLRPLSSYGSIVVPPGGRFNFGDISSYHQKFQALYIASDFPTAVAERFLRNQTEQDRVDQVSLDLRLDPNASFSSYRIQASNLNVLDLREDATLTSFVDIISEIQLAPWLSDLARKFKQPEPQTVKTVEQLKILLFDQIFTQWGSLLDQPSASQWFGYYTREAGIQAIIYPSVRNDSGFNLAVFPDNFRDTTACVRLIDTAQGVKPEDSVLDSKSALFQMQSSTVLSSELIH